MATDKDTLPVHRSSLARVRDRLLASWRPPAPSSEQIRVHLPKQFTALGEHQLYDETMSLQGLIDHLFETGLSYSKKVTDESVGGPLAARAAFMTNYRRLLGVNEVGSSGTVSTLLYGSNAEGGEAGGYANVTVVGAAVRGSSDPGNEIGGCIGSLQIGADGDERPVYATLWGSSYTLRGYPGVQPGGLMAYTAVVQNYFDGSGSRSCNYGYAAVTRPGIGDGGDFWNEPGIGFRYSKTYPVDFGFIVCGTSGEYPDGDDIGYRVAFQAGGEASPWAGRGEWNTRIGTGVVIQDWLQGGVHIHAPHRNADLDAAHIRLDAGHTDRPSFLECRVDGHEKPVMAVRGDGRIRAAPAEARDEVVTKAQLERAIEGTLEDGAWVVVGDSSTPWQNDWSNVTTGDSRFYRHAGRGFLELAATGGVSGSSAFELPSDLRPDRPVVLVGAAQGENDRQLHTAVVRVDVNGEVRASFPVGCHQVFASVSWRLARETEGQ